jgi:hypothetical protein
MKTAEDTQGAGGSRDCEELRFQKAKSCEKLKLRKAKECEELRLWKRCKSRPSEFQKVT